MNGQDEAKTDRTKKVRLIEHGKLRAILILLAVSVFLIGCKENSESDCPITDPVLIKPPEDSAVSGTPEEGYYYVNQDQTIWAGAWWIDQDEEFLRAGKEIKVGWFRPEGVELEIVGQRIEGQAAPLEVNIPCCYPTKFQATGLQFPAEGCWEVEARAGEEGLKFIVWVDP
jgi:hypothetical protein